MPREASRWACAAETGVGCLVLVVLEGLEFFFRGRSNLSPPRLAMESHHLQSFHFKPYSLRRGGATAAFREGATWEQLMETGRWQDVRTLRLYIADAALELSAFATPPPLADFLNASALRLRAALSGG